MRETKDGKRKQDDEVASGQGPARRPGGANVYREGKRARFREPPRDTWRPAPQAGSSHSATTAGPPDIQPKLGGCYKCGKIDHRVKDCPFVQGEDESKAYFQKGAQVRWARESKHRQKVAGQHALRAAATTKASGADGKLTIKNSILEYMLDSGCSQSCIDRNSFSRPRPEGLEELRHAISWYAQSRNLTLADPDLTVEAEGEIDLDVELSTLVGKINIRHIKFLIVRQNLGLVYIGREVQRRLGIDPMSTLIRRQNKGFVADVDMSVTDIDDVADNDHSPTLCSVSIDGTTEIDEALIRLVEKAVENGLPQTLAAKLTHLVAVEFRDLWRMTQGLDAPAKVRPMVIRLTPGATPRRCAQRRYNELERAFMHEHIAMLERNGLVYRNPDSAWASAALPVRKPDNTYRLCVDLRAVNALTIPSVWPMPHLEIVLQNLRGMRFFATLDLWQGYWQFPLDENSRDCQSIMTHEGVFTPTRMIQGSINSVNSFQSGMQEILGDLLYTICLLWIDDILVYANTIEELLENLRQIFTKLLAHGIRCSGKKCKLFLTSATWCGRVISEHGISPASEKIAALVELQTPVTGADLQQFICAMNWLRGALPNFNRVVKPLSDLLEKGLRMTQSRKSREAAKIKIQEIGWSAEHERAFAECKELLRNAVTLAFPDPNKMLCLFTDASEYAWGAILTQIPEEDLVRPVHLQRHEPLNFLGGYFKASSFNWSILEKEAYALVESCVRLEYLLIRDKGFKIFADHKNLLFLFDPSYRPTNLKKFTVAKLERWSLRLHALPFSIEHIDGVKNVWADLLSRWGAK